MSLAKPGNPELDRAVVEQFANARHLVDVAVTDVLGNDRTLQNLSQDALDDIEQSLRQTRVDIDSGLLVFSKFRTIRARQSVGGAVGPLKHRISVLEDAASAARSAAESDSTEATETVDEEPEEPAAASFETVEIAEEFTS